MKGRRFGSAIALLLVAWLGGVAGCASRVLPPPPEPDPMDRDEYVIGAADQLQISVWKNPELTGIVPVRVDGKISVALLDDVQAAGLTPLELKAVITESLREYISNPDVTVTVVQMGAHQIFMLGELQRQGPIPLTRNLRVLDALAIAGGFSTFADKSDIRVIRRTPDGLQEYRFDYDRYLSGRAPGSNMLLQPGDTIVVPE